MLQAVSIEDVVRMIHRHTLRWFHAVKPSIVRDAGLMFVDTIHPAYRSASAEFGAIDSQGPESDPRSLLWKELHLRPLALSDLSREAEWIERWLRRVPCGSCRRLWKELYPANPIDLSGAWGLARWGWHMHNLVNNEIGKATVSIEEATRLYGWDALTRIRQ